MRARWWFAFAWIFVGAGRHSAQRAAAGEPFDDRLGVRTPLVFLLMRSDIDAELGLEPPQVAEVKRFAADLYNRALRLRGRTDAGVVAARKEIDEAESAWMRTHLTPEQHRAPRADRPAVGGRERVADPACGRGLPGNDITGTGSGCATLQRGEESAEQAGLLDLRRAPRTHPQSTRGPCRETEAPLGKSARAPLPFRH